MLKPKDLLNYIAVLAQKDLFEIASKRQTNVSDEIELMNFHVTQNSPFAKDDQLTNSEFAFLKQFNIEKSIEEILSVYSVEELNFFDGKFDAVSIAVLNGGANVVRELSRRGCDFTRTYTSNNVDLLYIAVYSNQYYVLTALLDDKKLGFDLNRQYSDHFAPVSLAAIQPLRICLEELLNRGVNPNLANEFGETALHAAVRSQQYHNVELLLEFGASLNNKNVENDSPLDLVEKLGTPNVHKVVKAFLRSAA